ncbi:MAG: HAAS signaling domain-containing protein [Chloroflexota bacterium]
MNEQERRGLIDDYLNRVNRELVDVPADARRELLEDLRNHIEEAWASASEQNRATLLNILERLGEPEAVAREERERLGLAPEPPERGPDALSIAAIVLMVVFWPIGVILVWLSSRWRTVDKAIATALPVLGVVLMLSLTVAANTVYQGPVRTAEYTVVTNGQGQAQASQPNQSPARVNDVGVGIAEILAIYGFIGAPWTAAIYLAARLRTRRNRATALIPAIAVMLVFVGLFVVTFFASNAVHNPTVSAGPVSTSAIPIETHTSTK